MSYYPKPKSHIREKVKVVLDLSNYATKKELEHAKDIKLTSVSTSLNNLKTKAYDLDVGKIKTAPVDLKKSNDVVDNKVLKNIKFNTLKCK